MRHQTAVFCLTTLAMSVLSAPTAQVRAGDSDRVMVWPEYAPGEISLDEGTDQPNRAGEVPPVTRTIKIRRPSIDVFPADDPNGTAILVLPGGGFGKVVPDKEGSEAAPWLNQFGISRFVLRYRTNEVTPKTEPAWRRPLQDAQRALRIIRKRASEWKVNADRVGVLAFSAGGQVGSILHTAEGNPAYEAMDTIDDQNCSPDFSLLIYPWNVYDRTTDDLLPEIKPSMTSPPAFIVHTHDDKSSSLGSVLIYAGLKRHNIPAELHVFENGGHGYGMRAVAGSQIGTWPARAGEWLRLRGLAGSADKE
ncbi:MAG: alpha/beta hydrolase [Fuerstiella sp.]|nr:alpha/beta hydrolase [Fuerstiella sp.]MCP4788561.1 alpha/beta hydrolase [Fuerstiella sp.]MCP4858116.1 alpha/beta hydrolase [Fuerstiella sp.]